MTRKLISSGSTFEEQIGYSRAVVVDDDWIFVSGTTGFDYATMKITAKQYYLRPEIIESAFYLYRATGDTKYREMGETFFRGIVRYCKTDAGFAYLKDVVTKEKADGMESFFFAETLKYLYLIFAPKETISLEEIVFTTEAHPIRPTWKK